MGPIRVEPKTRQELVEHTAVNGSAYRGFTEDERIAFASRTGEVLQLIASTREYQMG